MRDASGSPTAFQGKAANTDGAVRYTAPSLIFTHRDGRRLEAGGYQPVEAYDAAIANLDPTLGRRPPAEDVTELLAAFPYALTTREVAAVMAPHRRARRAGGRDRADRRRRGRKRPPGEHRRGALWHLV